MYMHEHYGTLHEQSMNSIFLNRRKGDVSLVPRPLPHFISQPWRELGVSPQLIKEMWFVNCSCLCKVTPLALGPVQVVVVLACLVTDVSKCR